MTIKYKILNIKKILILIVVMFLLCNNEVEAMERSTEQKMDYDLYTDVMDDAIDRRFQQRLETLNIEERMRLRHRLEQFVDNVEDNNHNPNDTVQRFYHGYESILIFIGSSILGYILFRHGDILWDFITGITRDVINNIPNVSIDSLMGVMRLARQTPAGRRFIEDYLNSQPA